MVWTRKGRVGVAGVGCVREAGRGIRVRGNVVVGCRSVRIGPALVRLSVVGCRRIRTGLDPVRVCGVGCRRARTGLALGGSGSAVDRSRRRVRAWTSRLVVVEASEVSRVHCFGRLQCWARQAGA